METQRVVSQPIESSPQIEIHAPAAPVEQQKVPKTRGRSIVVTSGKGGVGKTTTTANLGVALAARGARVVLIDADVGLRNLDLVLGLESRVRHHVLDVLEGRVSLAAAQDREKDDVTADAMLGLVEQLRGEFDYVLIDSPAGIETGFKNAIVGADEAIVVCTPEVAAVRDVDRVIGLLGNRINPQLVVNRIRPALVRKGKMLSVEDVNSILRLPLLGVLGDAPDVIVSTNRGEPVALDEASATGAAYRAIAARIAGEDVAAPQAAEPEGFLDKLGSLFGGR